MYEILSLGMKNGFRIEDDGKVRLAEQQGHSRNISKNSSSASAAHMWYVPRKLRPANKTLGALSCYSCDMYLGIL